MFTLIKYSLLTKLRVKKWVIFNALFPIFLMLLIGTMLNNAMGKDFKLNPVTVYYLSENNKETKELLTHTEKALSGDTFKFEKIDSIEKGKKEVELNKNIFINLDNNNVNVYSSQKTKNEGAVLISTLKSINKSVAVIEKMYQVNPMLTNQILSSYGSNGSINTETLSKDKSPTSYDYYGVAELTLMILYIMIFALTELDNEKKNNIKERICLVENNRFKYYTSKILATFLLSIITILPGFLFSLFILNTNWGNPLISFAYVLIFAFLTCTVGTFIGIVFNDMEKSMAFIQGLIIPIIAFLGGSYMPLENDIEGVFQYVTYISPLRWLNQGLFKMIYSNDYSVLNNAVLIYTFVIIIVFALIFQLSKKEEVA